MLAENIAMQRFFSSVNVFFSRDWIYLPGCALLFAVLSLIAPSYFPLIEADSESYIHFSSYRPALYPVFLKVFIGVGFDLGQITYVQLALLSLALIVLLAALLRAGVPRIMIVVFVIGLGASPYFSTFFRTIMTEALFCAVMMMGLGFWIDYFRTGKAAALAWTGLCVGVAIGVRPAAITLAPMVLIGAWLKWRDRDVSRLVFGLALIVPLAMGPLAERVMHYAKHGANGASQATYLLIGKGAMVIREDTAFNGPYAATLDVLGEKLYKSFNPVHRFLADTPLGAVPALTAAYESVAQFQILRKEVADASTRVSVPSDFIFTELGRQAIKDNIPGYLRLSLVHYVGQWSVTSLTFPPTARAVNDYVSHHIVPLEGMVSEVTLHPPAKATSYVVYPAFLAAGVITLLLSSALIPALVYPSCSGGRRQYFLYAIFFSASCQSYTIFLSLVNVSTPRFILAFYPQLLLVVIFLILAIWPRLATPDKLH